MRVIGAKNFHLASVTKNEESEYTAGTPQKYERLVSIEFDNKVDSETVYSDDEVEEDVYGAIIRSGKVTLNYLSNETKVELFGGEIDANGVYFAPGDFQVKHHALLFQAPTSNNGNKYICYYDVVFELPSFKAETAEDKPKTQSVELAFKCYKNKELNTHYAELDTNSENASSTAASNWFTSVITEKATS